MRLLEKKRCLTDWKPLFAPNSREDCPEDKNTSRMTYMLMLDLRSTTTCK